MTRDKEIRLLSTSEIDSPQLVKHLAFWHRHGDRGALREFCKCYPPITKKHAKQLLDGSLPYRIDKDNAVVFSVP